MKNKILILYGLILVGIMGSFIFKYLFNLSPFLLTYNFFLLLLIPGFSLSRILRFRFNDLLSQIMLCSVLGLIFTFTLSLSALLLGFTLSMLLIAYFVVMSVLLLISLVLDILKPEELQVISFQEFKVSLRQNWPFYLIFLTLIVIVISGVDVQGANFRGDPVFHLAILRKATEGYPLTPVNLSYVRTQLHIAYSFPLWHIWVAILHRISGYNIFTIWNEVVVPLSLLAIFTWYWLFRNIVKKTGLAVLLLGVYLLLLVAMGKFYIYTRLPVPDTLGQHILLPLTLSLMLKYVFDLKNNFKLLLILSIFAVFMGVIHFTQYFYFLSIVLVFFLTFLVLGLKKKDYRLTTKRIFYSGALSVGLILPFLVVLQFTGKSLLETVKVFMESPTQALRYGTFQRIDIYAKYAYLFLPLLLIFIRKNRKLIFLFAIMLVMPIFYTEWLGLKGLATKFLSFIFINRLYANLVWYHAVIALTFGIFLMFFDLLVKKSTMIWKYFSWVLAALLALIFVLIIRAEIKAQSVTHLYKQIFSTQSGDYLNRHFVVIIIITLLIALLVVILQLKNKKIDEAFAIRDFRYPLVAAILMAIFIFFMSVANNPIYQLVKKEWRSRNLFRVTESSGGKVVSYNHLGGIETVTFIEKNIPPKSIFLADSGYYMLTILLDQHMASYSSSSDKIAAIMYDIKTPLDQRLKYIRDTKTNYVLMVLSTPEKIKAFEDYPQYFTKIYSKSYPVKYNVVDTAIIYQVNLENIKRDYP